ncbi:hypothetical protein V1515DRAFT_487942 [Lipomyces mesembrius]
MLVFFSASTPGGDTPTLDHVAHALRIRECHDGRNRLSACSIGVCSRIPRTCDGLNGFNHPRDSLENTTAWNHSNIIPAVMQCIAPEIKVRLLDDWMGVSDPKKRRTLQNRLNQRARRQRQRAAKARPDNSKHQSTIALGRRQIDFTGLDKFRYFGPSAEQVRRIIRELESLVHAEFATGSPCTDLLLGLTRLNLVRAMYANMDILGYTASEIEDDAQSLFSMVGPRGAEYYEAMLPPPLRPTVIQCTVPHHPWIDIIPIPRMRDNMILAGESIDDEQLCHDLCGKRTGVGSGIIVWKVAWDPAGWEVTETFMQLWGWAVQDCWDLFRSTNAWRISRGEKPLFRLPPEHSQ